ncbi:MAG: hypothetical protein ABEJ72_11405, partial [Candidatus Aenigmatarchaeota archaeon]
MSISEGNQNLLEYTIETYIDSIQEEYNQKYPGDNLEIAGNFPVKESIAEIEANLRRIDPITFSAAVNDTSHPLHELYSNDRLEP